MNVRHWVDLVVKALRAPVDDLDPIEDWAAEDEQRLREEETRHIEEFWRAPGVTDVKQAEERRVPRFPLAEAAREIYPASDSDWLSRHREARSAEWRATEYRPHMPIALWIALLGGLALSGCSDLTPAQQAQVTAGTAAATTLASIAAANNATVAQIVNQGALFCQKAGPANLAAPFVLANAAGAPVAVTGLAASAVAAACAALEAIPVSPPVAADSVAVVSAPGVTLPAVAAAAH